MFASFLYLDSVLEHLPGVAVVLDHFHVVKLMNCKLTEVRFKLNREFQDTRGKNVLKSSRWILLKNPENLNPQQQEHERLQEALEANETLAKKPTTSKRSCGRSGSSRTRLQPLRISIGG